ncbi:MAG: hypothetical protein QOI73_3063 [Solirubrobacteraceae bacterium]|nr:hypothetical protein [Solirubrobacteraceae bacterium]
MLRRCTIALTAAAALGLWLGAGAQAKRSTSCERARSTTLLETARVRVYELSRGPSSSRATASYACRKGSARKPVLLFDDGDGPGAAAGFEVLGLRVAYTLIGCDPTGFGCGSDAIVLDLRARRRLSAPAQPAGAQESDWEAVRALTSAAGTLVFSAQSPVNGGSASRPVTDARIAFTGADRVVHELDRGPAIEADSLAVARRAGRPSLFTWRSGGVLRSTEL